MSPSNLTFNSTDSGLLDSIFISDFSLQSHIVAYFSNLLCGQFSKPILFSASRCSVLEPVSLIGSRSVPSKISQVVISGVSIVVAAFVSFWWRSGKSHDDKPVDTAHFRSVVFPEKKIRPFVILGSGLYLQLAGFQRTNFAEIGHFVKALKTNNRLPIFHTVSIATCGIKVNGT